MKSETWQCRNFADTARGTDGCTAAGKVLHPRGPKWTKRTGIMCVTNSFFVDLVSLHEFRGDAMNARLAPMLCSATQLSRASRFMSCFCPGWVPPNMELLEKKLYAAWYGYETGYIRRDYNSDEQLCLVDGLLPDFVGIDCDAKACMGLKSDSLKQRLVLHQDTTAEGAMSWQCLICTMEVGSSSRDGAIAIFRPCGHRVCASCLDSHEACQQKQGLHAFCPYRCGVLDNCRPGTRPPEYRLVQSGVLGESGGQKGGGKRKAEPGQGLGRAQRQPVPQSPAAAQPAEASMDVEQLPAPAAAAAAASAAAAPAAAQPVDEGSAAAAPEAEPTCEACDLQEDRLMTDDEFLYQCRMRLLQLCLLTTAPKGAPDRTMQRGKMLNSHGHCKAGPETKIYARRVPPLIHAGLRGEARNTEVLKSGVSKLREEAELLLQGVSKDELGESLLTSSFMPFALLVRGVEVKGVHLQLDLQKLRDDPSGYKRDELELMVEHCLQDKAHLFTRGTRASAAAMRGVLLRIWDAMLTGESDCHLFVAAPHATGGTCVMSCRHRVRLGVKHLFNKESVRDACDMLRSLKLWPPIVAYDDACGLVRFMTVNYPQLAKQLFEDSEGRNHMGCFREFVSKDDKKIDLSPIHILELTEDEMSKKRGAAARNEKLFGLADKDASDKWLASAHPLLGKFGTRLCLTDRWHQRLGSTSHKSVKCQQHAFCLCPSIAWINTNGMESINREMNKRLASYCNQEPGAPAMYPCVQTRSLPRATQLFLLATAERPLRA